MCSEPQCGEVRIKLFGEKQVEVGLDVGRVGQAWVVPKHAQLRTVRDDPPQAVVLGVEVFMHQSMGCLPASIVAKHWGGFVEVEVECRQQKWNRLIASAMGEFEDSISKRDAAGGGEVFVSQDGAQKGDEPLVDADLPCRKVVEKAPLGVAGVEIVGDAPVSGEFFL